MPLCYTTAVATSTSSHGRERHALLGIGRRSHGHGLLTHAHTVRFRERFDLSGLDDRGSVQCPPTRNTSGHCLRANSTGAGPTFASAMISTFLTQSERIHSALLVLYIDPTRSVIRTMLMSGGAVSDLSEVIQREANVLAFRDAYELCAIVGCVTLVLVALIRHAPPTRSALDVHKSIEQ